MAAAAPLRNSFNVVETLLTATVGGVLLDLAGFPAGWLAGAMVFSAAAALAGRRMFVPQLLARVCFITLGISIGAVATPETVAGMASWPLSVVIVCVAMGVVTIAVVVYLKRLHGWDTQTAVFAGTPGGLAQVMALAAAYGCDLRAVGIVQSMRVIILAVCVPGGLALFGLAGPTRMPPGTRAIAEAPGEFALLVGTCVISALGLLRLGFPGGLIFGPLVVSAVLHGGGFVHLTLPQWFANMAAIGLGAVAGARFTGTPFRALLDYLGAALGAFAVSLVVAAAFALLASFWLSLRISDLVVAYAPGAVDAMMILSLALHLDPVFVGAHHLARVLTVTLALPLVVRYTEPAATRKTKTGRPSLPRGDGLDD
jgi:uncharacterized protein